jgi:hypothetical protein
VTALAFVSPRPLLAGATTAGTVALWSVPDCTCILIIIPPAISICSTLQQQPYSALTCLAVVQLCLSAACSSRNARQATAAMSAPAVVAAGATFTTQLADSNEHDEQDRASTTASTAVTAAAAAATAAAATAAAVDAAARDSRLVSDSAYVSCLRGSETLLLYAGSESGCVLCAELAVTQHSGFTNDAYSLPAPVPSRRRPNHNPYRVVRETAKQEAVAARCVHSF